MSRIYIIILFIFFLLVGCSDQPVNSLEPDEFSFQFKTNQDLYYQFSYDSERWNDYCAGCYTKFADTFESFWYTITDSVPENNTKELVKVNRYTDEASIVHYDNRTECYIIETDSGIYYKAGTCGHIMSIFPECDSSEFKDIYPMIKYPLYIGCQWTYLDDSVHGRIDKRYDGRVEVEINSSIKTCHKFTRLYDRDRDGVFEPEEIGYEYYNSEGLAKRYWEKSGSYWSYDIITSRQILTTYYYNQLIQRKY